MCSDLNCLIETRFDRAENGQIIEECQYFGSRKHGLYKRRTETGRLVETGNYRFDQKDGNWVYYAKDNGYYTVNYQNGKQNGLCAYYYPPRPWDEDTYWTENGVWLKFSPTEYEYLEKVYQAALLNQVYHDSSLKNPDGTFHNPDLGLAVGYICDVQMAYCGSYQNGIKNGFWSQFRRNGSVYSRFMYRHGVLYA